MKNRTVLKALIPLLLTQAAIANGAPYKLERLTNEVAKLDANMPHVEVVRLWGPPTEKIDYESTREELWLYSNRSVRFLNGLVSKWEESSNSPILLITDPQNDEAAPAEEETQIEHSDEGGIEAVIRSLIDPASEVDEEKPAAESPSPLEKTGNSEVRDYLLSRKQDRRSVEEIKNDMTTIERKGPPKEFFKKLEEQQNQEEAK